MSGLAGFITRRVGLGLLAIGVMLLGGVAYFRLPVAALPSSWTTFTKWFCEMP